MCVCVGVCLCGCLAQLVAGLYDMPAALSMLLFQGLTVKGQRTNAQPDTDTDTDTEVAVAVDADVTVAVNAIAVG